MKMKNAILIFCLALLFTLTGAMFKLMHWQGANIMLFGGLISQFIALVILMYIIYRAAKNKGALKD